MNNKVVLLNNGTRGAVDIDLPGTGREHEMLVTRKRASADGVSDEVVKQIVKVNRPHSITLRARERRVFDRRILDDPVIASRIRSGVLTVIPYREPITSTSSYKGDGSKSVKPFTKRSGGKAEKE